LGGEAVAWFPAVGDAATAFSAFDESEALRGHMHPKATLQMMFGATLAPRSSLATNAPAHSKNQ
jgi:hypothetical protein